MDYLDFVSIEISLSMYATDASADPSSAFPQNSIFAKSRMPLQRHNMCIRSKFACIIDVFLLYF
jgi:hypothetical protein